MAAPKKKNRKKIIIFSLLGLLVVIVVLVVILGGSKETIVTVQTERIARATITQVVEATGKIQPQTQVKINAEVSGEIIDLPVKEGDRVRRGQVLVRIKPESYLADREQAVANVNRSKSSLEQRQADFRKIESEYRRQQQLFQKGLISEADLETIKNTYEVAKASVDAARYDVQNSQAILDRSKESLAKTTIFSPIDGVVSQLISKLGERVSGSSFMQGTEIMTVSNLALMEARVEVNENDVVLISIGDTARVEVDAYPDSAFNAVVYQIANTAKTSAEGTQEEVTNFEVRLVMVDKDVVFRPGMSCSARIETETRRDVIAVPLQSVTTREGRKEMEQAPEGGPDETADAGAVQEKKEDRTKKKPDEVVFVVENGVARKKVVTTGISGDLLIEITSGVQEGQMVVKGSYRAISRELEDSTRVRVDNKGKDAWKTSK
jgi:HlyD family secretion protein